MIAARPLRRGRAEPACTAAARAVTIGHSARAVLAMESCVDVLCRSLRSCAGVRLGLLFGSHAQQRARADSDLDLAVELDPGVDARRLAADLSAAVGREVDLVVLGGAEVGYPLLKALVDHGRVLLRKATRPRGSLASPGAQRARNGWAMVPAHAGALARALAARGSNG